MTLRRTTIQLFPILAALVACRPASTPTTAPAAAPSPPADQASPVSYSGVTPSGRLASGDHAEALPQNAPDAHEPSAPADAHGSASPSSATQLGSGPRWVCEKPVMDMGDRWENKVIPLTFDFRNAGGAALHLSDVKSACHCTVAKNWPREIPPGRAGSIAVTFSTQNMNGPVDRTLDVTTDDPARPLVKLTVKANVKTLLTLDPKNGGVFVNIKPDQPLHRVVRLRSNIESPLSLQLLTAPNRSIFSVQFKEVAPGKEFELTIDAPPPIPEGSSATQLRFKTNSPDVPIFKMNLSAYVQPRLAINPPKVVIDPPSPMEKTRQIHVVNNGPTPIHMLSIAASEPRLAVRLLPLDPKKANQQVIEFTVPANYQPPAYAEAIEIRTDDAEKPVIVVPVQPSFDNPKRRPADHPLLLTPGQMPPTTTSPSLNPKHDTART